MRAFFGQLLILSTILFAILLGIHQYTSLGAYQGLTWSSLAFFVLFSLGLIVFAQKTAEHENKQLFGQVFLISTGLKMLISLSIVLVYFVWVKPDNKYFVLPFLGIYLVYTIFEVYFMTKLAKTT